MSSYLAIFAVKSVTLSPDIIGEILAATPDSVAVKGEVRTPPRLVPKKFGWYIECKNFANDSVVDTFHKLIMRVEPLLMKINSLRSRDPHVEIAFSISIAPHSDDISLFFSEHAISTVAAFKASLDVDFFPELNGGE
jgi:hypothetical protein